MKTSWTIGIFTLFILLSLISGVIEMQYLSAGTDQEAIFERLFASPSLSWDTISAFWDCLWFDYAFFNGAWQIFRWIFFIPVGAGVAISFMLLILSALSNIVSSVGRLLRIG